MIRAFETEVDWTEARGEIKPPWSDNVPEKL
jgi:hypothetical protein